MHLFVNAMHKNAIKYNLMHNNTCILRKMDYNLLIVKKRGVMKTLLIYNRNV